MAMVELGRADMMIPGDPTTRVEIPHLTGMTRRRSFDQATPHFLGDEYPTLYRGVSKTHTVPLKASYSQSRHADMLALIRLFETADAGAGVIQLRTEAFQVAGLDEMSYVAVGAVEESSDPVGQLWAVSFTATRINYSPAV